MNLRATKSRYYNNSVSGMQARPMIFRLRVANDFCYFCVPRNSLHVQSLQFYNSEALVRVALPWACAASVCAKFSFTGQHRSKT